MSATFPPYDQPRFSWIPFIAFAPLSGALLLIPPPSSWRKRLGLTFALGFCSSALFFLLTLEWIRVVAWEGWLTLPLYLALYAGLWSLFVGVLLRDFLESTTNFFLKNFSLASLAAAAWSALEWLRGTLFTGFGWNSFGVAFHHTLPFIQIADITGVSGVSFLGVLFGCMLALSWRDVLQKKKIQQLECIRLKSDWIVTLFLLLALMVYGMHELSAPDPSERTLRIAAIEGNIPQDHKWDRLFEQSIMEIYTRHSEVALALHPDLVVWPEAATPKPLLYHQETFSRVQTLLKKGNADFLIGSLQYENNPQKDYNAAILLRPRAIPGMSNIDYYAKIHLVPFGEYIPFRKSFPFFAWMVGNRILGDFDAGPGPKLFLLSHQNIKVAPLLCFEDTIGDLVRRFAQLRAQALINLTNDGWFNHSAASKQHQINALFRSVETKLPLLRVANTGVTCLIDRFGRLISQLDDGHGNTFIEGVMMEDWRIPVDPTLTFYTQHGDVFAQSCLALTLLSLLFFVLRRIKKN